MLVNTPFLDVYAYYPTFYLHSRPQNNFKEIAVKMIKILHIQKIRWRKTCCFEILHY